MLLFYQLLPSCLVVLPLHCFLHWVTGKPREGSGGGLEKEPFPENSRSPGKGEAALVLAAMAERGEEPPGALKLRSLDTGETAAVVCVTLLALAITVIAVSAFRRRKLFPSRLCSGPFRLPLPVSTSPGKFFFVRGTPRLSSALEVSTVTKN